MRRHELELYVRWLQKVHGYKPSTVSRPTSVVAGFYRTCVIDGVLARSPADYLRRPTVPAESPTLGLTHLQFEALLHVARQSADRHDFALVAMLGLLGLRIFEATAADITNLGEEHGPCRPRARPGGRRRGAAAVDLRDVQIAARHADPRTTMRYDRARKNLDRHANYILAAYMAAGT